MSADPKIRLQLAWQQTWREIWRPLLNQQAAPADLSIELLRRMTETTRPSRRGDVQRYGVYLTDAALNRLDLDLDLNSQSSATSALRSIRPSDIRNYQAAFRFLEAAALVVESFEQPPLAEAYVRLIRRFVGRYNLPYTVQSTPLTLRLRLPAVLDRTYAALERAAISDPHLAEALDAFSHAWSSLADDANDRNLKGAIEKASKLAEAFAARQAGSPGTLGDLVKILARTNTFPHASVGEIVSKIYGFCSDFPHIRHAGNPSGVRRQLEPRDAAFLSTLLVTFSAYANGWPDEP